MHYRTDLAVDLGERQGEIKGVNKKETDLGQIKLSEIIVTDDDAAKLFGRPVGRYVTLTLPAFSSAGYMPDEAYKVLKETLCTFLPPYGTVLVVGLGNRNLTPDSVGPRVADAVIATRHISYELSEELGLGRLRPVAVMSTGVLGDTGLESAELIMSAVDVLSPSAVLTVDALAAKSMDRLGCTVQITDSGITPGSGVGNNRKEVCRRTVGVPVISVGIPTVVDAATLVYDLTGIELDEKGAFVTPKDIDIITARAAKFLSVSLNCALQSGLSAEDINALLET